MSHDQESYPGVLLSKRSGKSAAVFGGGGQRRGGINWGDNCINDDFK